MIVLNIPHGVWIPDGGIAGDLSLFKSPLGQRFGGAGEDTFDKVVMELELGGDGIDHLPLLASDDLQSPDVIGISSSILSVSSNLEVSLTNWSWFTVTVDVSS